MDRKRVAVRRAALRDLEKIYACEAASFAEPWTYAMLYDDIFENANTVYLVVELSGEIIGYGGMWVVMDEAHITNVCILPEYRKKGYARVLMKELIRMGKERGAQSMTLEVRVSNKPALRLYKQCGHGYQLHNYAGYEPRHAAQLSNSVNSFVIVLLSS